MREQRLRVAVAGEVGGAVVFAQAPRGRVAAERLRGQRLVRSRAAASRRPIAQAR